MLRSETSEGSRLIIRKIQAMLRGLGKALKGVRNRLLIKRLTGGLKRVKEGV